MSDDVRVVSSRRSVLAATLGAAAAWVAGAFTRLPTVKAGADGDVVLGAANVAAAVTTISFAASDALVGRSGSGAHSGLWGDNTGGGYGVAGSTTSAATAGMWGNNAGNGEGVRGTSDGGDGVHGRSQSAAHSGVWGNNGAGGYGVSGSTTSAGTAGVWGSNAGTGIGVLGSSTNGTGVRAQSTTGRALNVIGKAHFSRSGKATIAPGNKSIKIFLGGVSASSMVLATLSRNIAGRYVASVVPTAGSFTIYLNAAVAGNAPVSWFVLDT